MSTLWTQLPRLEGRGPARLPRGHPSLLQTQASLHLYEDESRNSEQHAWEGLGNCSLASLSITALNHSQLSKLDAPMSLSAELEVKQRAVCTPGNQELIKLYDKAGGSFSQLVCETLIGGENLKSLIYTARVDMPLKILLYVNF